MLEKTAVIREYVRWCEGTEAKTNAFVESTGLNVTLASSYSISKWLKMSFEVRSTDTETRFIWYKLLTDQKNKSIHEI